jgi:hypothetical protein
MKTLTRRRVPTDADLERFGFTSGQITQLTRLRDSYPYIEWTTSAREWRELCFLRWRVQAQRMSLPSCSR